MSLLASPENAEKAVRMRELSPRALHSAIEGIVIKLSAVSSGQDGDLTAQEYAVLLQWMVFSRDMSTRRIELMQRLSDQIPTMRYPKTAETMLLAMVDNWFFAEGKVQDTLFEQLRKSVLDKAPKEGMQKQAGGVSVAGDKKSYHRPEWGTTLRKEGTETVGGKGTKKKGP